MGTPALFPYSQQVQQLKGAAFLPLDTPPQKQQEHSNHCIPTTNDVSAAASVHCTLLQARGGKMRLNHVPSRDLLIAVCSRKQ